MSKKENFLKGFFNENPIFVFLLGMCPALAVTATFETALGMGLLVIFVLTFSNIVVSLLRHYIPEHVRTPSYIVIIATFVTLVEMFTEAYAFALYESLGIFIPLIVVNCLILGRAESFASKNNVLDSAIDGLGMALGFTFALIVIGSIREFLATGGLVWGEYLPFFVDQPVSLSLDLIIHLFDDSITIKDFGLAMFSLPPGAFIALAFILAFFQFKKVRKEEKEAAAKKAWIEQKKKEALARKKAKALKESGEAA
ncbi:MAG: electron transport complex subunit E [Candidatus Izemoplasma sp.]|nr:electron transport complex subunit E [Candidatus Izemoplasma sp.]